VFLLLGVLSLFVLSVFVFVFEKLVCCLFGIESKLKDSFKNDVECDVPGGPWNRKILYSLDLGA